MPVVDDPALSPVRTHEDLLGVVPHLLGFHPQESLVLLVLVAGRLELTARLDLAAVREPADLDALLRQLRSRFPGASLTGIAYSANARRAWTALGAAELAAGERWEGSVHVDGARWWLAPGAVGVSYRPGETVAAAEATLLGLQARPSRGCLADSVATDPDVGAWHRREYERARRAADRATGAPGRVLTGVLADVLAGRVALDDAACARLAALAADQRSREAAILFTTAPIADALVGLWTTVVRRVPRPASAAALGLLGLAAWVRGDGALQNVCLEQGLLIDAEHDLLSILSDLNAAMVPPSRWPGMRAMLAARVRAGRRRTSPPRT